MSVEGRVRLIRLACACLAAAVFAAGAAAEASGQGKTGGGGAAAPQSKALAEVRRQVDAGNAAAVRAWETGDAELFASAFAEDGREMRPDGTTVRGRRRIVELVRASMKRLGPGVVLTVETTGLWLDGDTAYETGRSVYRYTQDGQPRTFETLFVTVWKRQRGGRWKIHADMPVPRG